MKAKDRIYYALLALAAIAAGAVALHLREPVNHDECPAPFDADYRDCDWWPRRE